MAEMIEEKKVVVFFIFSSILESINLQLNEIKFLEIIEEIKNETNT